MTWPDAFAVAVVALSLALLFVGITWAATRRPPPPPPRRKEPMRWTYTYREYPPRAPRWVYPRRVKEHDE